MRNHISIMLASAMLLAAPLLANAQDILRDPTRPFYARAVSPAPGTGSSGGGVASYDVTAIFTSDLRRVAVINGQRVVEGDQVDGATVIEILADSLRLNVRGNVVTTRVLTYGFRK